MRQNTLELPLDRYFLTAAASVPHVGPVNMRRLIRFAESSGLSGGEICCLDADTLTAEAGLDSPAARSIASINAPFERGEVLIDRIEEHGGRVIFEGDDLYPEALSRCLDKSAPVVLFAVGELDLLMSPALGVVGSRSPSDKCFSAATDLSGAMANRGWVIVSGAASGIDSAAHAGALQAGGGTVILPPEGVFRFRLTREVRERLDSGRWCVLSPFEPDARWEARNALRRNRLITALSRAVIAFEPRDRGGTWHSSNQTLKMNKTLFVLSNHTDTAHINGLNLLKRRGAVELDVVKMPECEELEKRIEQLYEKCESKEQAQLFQGF